MDFREGRVDSGDGGALEAAMRAEMALVYDGLDLQSPDMPAAGAAELNPPRGVFLVGYEDGLPICCGGIKDLGDGACEIKRMYVAPEAQHLYESAGYAAIANFNKNPVATFFGEKRLW